MHAGNSDDIARDGSCIILKADTLVLHGDASGYYISAFLPGERPQ